MTFRQHVKIPTYSTNRGLSKNVEVGSISIPRGKCGMEFLSSTIRGIWNIPLELESNWREPITHLYVGIVQLFTSPRDTTGGSSGSEKRVITILRT
jgi:hypothetical protein